MKNVIRVLGIIALVALIGLSFAGCDTGGGASPAPGPAGPPPPQKTVYTWDAGDDSFELVVTEASNSRAAYTPKSGDTYVLTIKPGDRKSSGTVDVTSSSGKESTLKLTPATPTGAGTPFTVRVVETATNALVTDVKGDITLVDGKTEPEPEEVIPTKIYETFNFTANIWDNERSSGETWSHAILLSEFTPYKPEKGDKFTFRLRGTTNAVMNWFGFNIFNFKYNPFVYQWLGHSDKDVKLSGPFDVTLTVTIDNEPNFVDEFFNFHMENFFWEWLKDSNEYLYNNGAKLPEGTQPDDVMATIRNFNISLVKIEFADKD